MRVIADTDDLQQRNPGEKAAFITCSWNTKLATLGHLNIQKFVRFKPIRYRTGPAQWFIQNCRYRSDESGNRIAKKKLRT